MTSRRWGRNATTSPNKRITRGTFGTVRARSTINRRVGQPPPTVIKNLFGRGIGRKVRFEEREESERSKEDLIEQINKEIQDLPIYLDVIEEKNSNLLLKLWNEPIKTRRITANVDTVGDPSNKLINTIPLIGGDDISDVKNSFLAIQYMVDKKLIKSEEQRNNTLKDWLLCRGLNEKKDEKKIHEVDLSKGNFQDYTSLKELTEDWHLNLFCEASETNSERDSNKEILLPMTNLLMEKRELQWFIYKKDLKDVLENEIISIDAVNNQFEKPSAKAGNEDISKKRSQSNRRRISIGTKRSHQYEINSLWEKYNKARSIRDISKPRLKTLQAELNATIQKYVQKYGFSYYFNNFVNADFKKQEIRDIVNKFADKNSEIKEMQDRIKNLKKKNPEEVESEYETSRLQNIERNKAVLRKMGLGKIYTEDKAKLLRRSRRKQGKEPEMKALGAQSEEDEAVDESTQQMDTNTGINGLEEIDREHEEKILKRTDIKIYYEAKPLHKNEDREYGTVKSFEPIYHQFNKMPEKSFAYNTFISFFNSKDPFVIIPFFADISDIESIEKLVYYYKSKANQLRIDILIKNSAQEEIDNLYEDVVTNILKVETDLEKTMNENKAFLCGEVKKDKLNEWESKYKDTMKKILDDKTTINEKEKIILKHFIKQRFTKWFIQYKNKFEVSLTKINLYYE